MLWIALALLLIATLAALLYPLRRAPAAVPSRAEFDLSVYRAQLAELDGDVGRGLVSPDQAGAARLEIERRMLAAGGETVLFADDGRARMTAAIVIALIVPLGAGLLYSSIGNPRLPDRPYAERLENDGAVILANQADKLSSELAARPSARGYSRLGDLHMLQRDFEQAAEAYRRAIALGADTASAWADLGESLALLNEGVVVPQALAAFARALTLDAREPRARFFAGLAEAQIGDFRSAVAIWRDLAKDIKAEVRPVLERQIASAAKLGRFDPQSVPPAPPSAAALNAAVEAMSKAMKKP